MKAKAQNRMTALATRMPAKIIGPAPGSTAPEATWPRGSRRSRWRGGAGGEGYRSGAASCDSLLRGDDFDLEGREDQVRLAVGRRIAPLDDGEPTAIDAGQLLNVADGKPGSLADLT